MDKYRIEQVDLVSIFDQEANELEGKMVSQERY